MNNSEELTGHRIAVHKDKMIRCKSCARFFENRQEFEKHSIEVHGSASQSGFDSGVKQKYEEKADDTESILLKRTMEEDKARKRTRGPYRKSAAT
ncbi:MAG: hypothetical protein ACRD99_03945 [Nitrososphaera sp.]